MSVIKRQFIGSNMERLDNYEYYDKINVSFETVE